MDRLPAAVMKPAEFHHHVGERNICANILVALYAPKSCTAPPPDPPSLIPHPPSVIPDPV